MVVALKSDLLVHGPIGQQRQLHIVFMQHMPMSFFCITAPPTKYQGTDLTSEAYKALRTGFIRQRKQG